MVFTPHAIFWNLFALSRLAQCMLYSLPSLRVCLKRKITDLAFTKSDIKQTITITESYLVHQYTDLHIAVAILEELKNTRLKKNYLMRWRGSLFVLQHICPHTLRLFPLDLCISLHFRTSTGYL